MQRCIPHRQRRDLKFVQQALHLSSADADAEELCGEIRDLVRFVQDDRVRAGQEFDKARFFHREVGQQQVVVKNLETNYRKVPGVSAATILGDGSVALILDVADLHRLSQSKKENRIFGNRSQPLEKEVETS